MVTIVLRRAEYIVAFIGKDIRDATEVIAGQ